MKRIILYIVFTALIAIVVFLMNLGVVWVVTKLAELGWIWIILLGSGICSIIYTILSFTVGFLGILYKKYYIKDSIALAIISAVVLIRGLVWGGIALWHPHMYIDALTGHIVDNPKLTFLKICGSLMLLFIYTPMVFNLFLKEKYE